MPTVQHAIDVAASPDQCWRIFSNLGSWPGWFPFLRHVEGELRAGGRLRLGFAAGPATMPIDVTIEELAPAVRVRWIGAKLGVRADHHYLFEMNNPGLTRVTSSECFSGLGARLITGRVLDLFDGEVHRSMQRFRALVEAAPT